MTTSWTYGISAPAPSPSIGDLYPLAKQDDHATYASSQLLAQYKNLPRMVSFVESICGLLQPLEDVCWQLLRERYIDAIDGYGGAVGIQLDGLGQLVGEPRKGLPDAHYRTFLEVRALVNTSNGFAEDLLEIVEKIGFDYTVYIEIYPAHIEIYVGDSDYSRVAFLLLNEAKPAGVGLTFIYSEYPDDETFAFSDLVATEQTDVDQGFCSVYGVEAGGRLSGVFRS